jgi:hypothetical protein
MKGEWILVADNIDCGWTSQQHSAMADFSIKNYGCFEICRFDTW